MGKEIEINYEAPSSIVINVKTEGVICKSGGNGTLSGFINCVGDAWSGGSGSGGSSMGGWTDNGVDAWE